MRRRWSHEHQLPHLRGPSRRRLEERLARSFLPLTTLVHPILHGSILQELLKDAAKAVVRRMRTVKKRRVGLNMPQWVIDEYQKRPKGETAELLMKMNFDKARYGITHIYDLKISIHDIQDALCIDSIIPFIQIGTPGQVCLRT